MFNSSILSKSKPMFIGHFLGDALGLPFEHQHSRNTTLYTGMLSGGLGMKRVGMYGRQTELEAGQVSDDSEMTMVLARHLFENNFTIDKERLVLSYMEWANHPTCFGMGKNTRQLFKGVKTYSGYLNRLKANDKTSQSNGAMMRCSSLVLIPDEEEMMKCAELDCSISNPHPVPVNVNKVYLKILRSCFFTAPKQSIIHDAYALCTCDEVRAVFEEALAAKPRNLTENKGFCLHALYCVVYCLVNFDSYTSAVSWVIKQGGDTDTNACIVGAVFGAHVGYENLMKEQSENIKILLGCTTTGGNKPRPNSFIPGFFIKKYFSF